jgi:tRNA(Arg) A34 adenosine deaminase TadA
MALAATEAAVWACMELAWTAFGAGSVPVGAVLLDGEGAAVASGRNRMYEQEAPPPQIANSRLAHAEVNALIGLSPGRRYEDHHLVTALEPCPLCIGAVVLSTVGTLTYLGGDPYAGAVGSFGQTPHTRRVPLRIRGPRRDPLGGLASALQIAWYLQRIPEGHVVRMNKQLRPYVVAAAESLLAAGAFQRAASGEPSSRQQRTCLPHTTKVSRSPAVGCSHRYSQRAMGSRATPLVLP